MKKQSSHSLRNKLLLLVGCVLSIGFCQTTLAQVYSGGFNPDRVKNLRWISVLPESDVKTMVVGANQWNRISSKVKLTRVKTGEYDIRVSTEIGTQPEVVGEMTPYCFIRLRGGICANFGNWGSAKIVGFTNEMQAMYGNSISQREATYIHEFGHALSLDHVLDLSRPSIMHQAPVSTVLIPQIIDKANLREKWGK
jgi:hypothetical protein